MAELGISLLSVALFAVVFWLSKLTAVARRAADRAIAGSMAILDDELSDDEKEKLVRASAIRLLGDTALVVLWLGACLAAAAAPVLLLDWLGMLSAAGVVALMLSWEFIVGTTVALVLAGWLLARRRPAETATQAYSTGEQFVHALAFAGVGLQVRLARFEDRLFRRALADIPAQEPVFITGLPRSGTTILLSALSADPSLASHTYRDMPFLASPLLWHKLSRPFTRDVEVHERAHGDGIEIGLDSPEALEEVIWIHFWKERYGGDRIELWRVGDDKETAQEFMRRHFRKIAYLRRGSPARYVSKNNNNVARLDLLRSMFPDCRIVLAIRDPAEHAASLLRQHRNFADLHAREPFAKRYMADIGHFEFGELHAPFAFPGFAPGDLTPDDPDYWLAYWCAAYGHVGADLHRAIVVPLERVGADPVTMLTRIGSEIGADLDVDRLATWFRPVPARADRAAYDPAILERANAIYAGICSSGY